jgi:hypothetical protein
MIQEADWSNWYSGSISELGGDPQITPSKRAWCFVLWATSFALFAKQSLRELSTRYEVLSSLKVRNLWSYLFLGVSNEIESCDVGDTPPRRADR